MEPMLSVCLILSAALPSLSFAEGDEEKKSSSQDLRNTREVKNPTDVSSHPIKPSASELNTQNNRMKTLEGSRSPWSGQFNLTYNGSSLSHPFSADAPNPGGQVPPPLVTMSGTAAVRYRLDAQTTAGVGTGVTTQTPFQGPKNTTFADPYFDIARSYSLGPILNRADLQTTLWTSQQAHDQYGYRFGLTLVNESFHQFDCGFTAGFVLGFDYNFFSGDPQYQSSIEITGNQTQWDVITSPYFEYVLSKRVNLRTVIGIQSLNNRDLNSSFAFYHPKIYETLGVGVQVLDAWFIYPFVQFFPYSIMTNNMLVGFNTIINLF